MNFNGEESTIEIIMQTVLTFLSWNILTGYLMDIYFTCREKLEKKMNIKDLHY